MTDANEFGLENYTHPDKFGQWLGYRVLSVDRSAYKAVTELKIREDHLSPAGRVHGGVVSAFFDFSCGAAVFATMQAKDFCSTVELKVNYLRPIELGDTLEARAEVVFRGKKLCVVRGEVLRANAGGVCVAIATATFNVVSRT